MTEIIDKLFLELSQFTHATTARELALLSEVKQTALATERLAVWFERHARKSDQLGMTGESERYAWAAAECRRWAKEDGQHLPVPPVSDDPLGHRSHDESSTKEQP